jgi:hypothetical protein
MKKLFLALVLLAVMTGSAFAVAGTATCTETYQANGMVKQTMAWTANSSDGTMPVVNLNTAGCNTTYGYIVRVVTNPGATAPTDNYTVAITDTDGVALLGSPMAANRDTTNSEQVYGLAVDGSTPIAAVAFTDALSVAISGNSVNSATGTVVLYIQR